MTALTVRLPDEKHIRLRAMAQAQGTTINGLIDEMATVWLTQHDIETRFRVRALRGSKQLKRGLNLLAKARGE